MKRWWKTCVTGLVFAAAGVAGVYFAEVTNAAPAGRRADDGSRFDGVIRSNAVEMLDEGRQTFRFGTFGDEAFCGDLLGLHRAIEGTALGGVATPDLGIDGVSPISSNI